MSQTTAISWADSTASPWFGCSEVSPGCVHCYARELTLKYKWAGWGDKAPRVRSKGFEKNLRAMNRRPWTCDGCGRARKPWSNGHLKRPALREDGRPSVFCPKCGSRLFHRRRIFPSLMDWLDPQVPVEWLADFLRIIHETPNLNWLLLTKRPELYFERTRAAIATCSGWTKEEAEGAVYCPENVWVGITVEDQKRADERIPKLLKIPAKVRWLSVEPLLGRIDFRFSQWVASPSSCCPTTGHIEACCPALPADASAVGFAPTQTPRLCFGAAEHAPERNRAPLNESGSQSPGKPKCDPVKHDLGCALSSDWVVVGGESGPKRRDCGVEAICDVARQCQAAGVPVWVKQDCASKPGQQGRIPDKIWNLKQLPRV